MWGPWIPRGVRPHPLHSGGRDVKVVRAADFGYRSGELSTAPHPLLLLLFWIDLKKKGDLPVEIPVNLPPAEPV
jgi:hypothetical protein